MGKVDLRHGSLEETSHFDFLTGATKVFVNNFNGVFSHRSAKSNTKYMLDDYIAGIFASLPVGSILVSLHPLPLPLAQKEANERRGKHGFSTSSKASFYMVEELDLGEACDSVKWIKHSGNRNMIKVYKYTRLEQEEERLAVFQCANAHCSVAQKGTPLLATKKNEQGRCVINNCVCNNVAGMRLRNTTKRRASRT